MYHINVKTLQNYVKQKILLFCVSLKKSFKNTHLKCFKIILTQTFIIKQFQMHQVQDCGGKRAF